MRVELERAALFARQFEIFLQPFGFRFQRGRLALDLVEFGAQRLVRGARLVQHAGEADRLRFFLLERTQRGVERGDQFVEGLLEIVELADLAAGIGQQAAQFLVFLAHARADVGQIFDADMAAVAVAVRGARRQRAGLALAAEQIRKLRHDKRLPTRTPQNSTRQSTCLALLRYYIPLLMGTRGHRSLRAVWRRHPSWLTAEIMESQGNPR